MARIRSVHPDICLDDTLVEVSARAERTFVRLWTHLDDEGRCVDNPRLLKAALYPLDDGMTAEEVMLDLVELAGRGLIIRYEVEGRRYVAAKPKAWADRQHPRHPTPSKLPPPPESGDPPSGGSTAAKRRNGSADGRKPPAVVVGVEGEVVKKPSAASPLARDHGFVEFWKVYPPRNGRKVGRAKALDRWAKFSLEDRRDAYRAAVRYAQACGAGETIAKDAERFLASDYWRDWLESAEPTRPVGVPVDAVPDGHGGWVVSGVAT